MKTTIKLLAFIILIAFANCSGTKMMYSGFDIDGYKKMQMTSKGPLYKSQKKYIIK